MFTRWNLFFSFNIHLFLSFLSNHAITKYRLKWSKQCFELDLFFKRNCHFLHRPSRVFSPFKRISDTKRHERLYARVDDGGEGESGERRREISRWHNQWTIRPVDSINPCYGAGLRVATTTLTINSTRINVNRWHCAARLSRLVKTVEASRADDDWPWNRPVLFFPSKKREISCFATWKKKSFDFAVIAESRFSRVVQRKPALNSPWRLA